MVRLTPVQFNLANGIKGNLLSAQDGKNQFQFADISGPKSQMDKLFGPQGANGGQLGKNFMDQIGGKGGADASKGGAGAGQDGQGKGPFDGLANMFKGTALGDLFKGLNNLAQNFDKLAGKDGKDSKPSDGAKSASKDKATETAKDDKKPGEPGKDDAVAKNEKAGNDGNDNNNDLFASLNKALSGDNKDEQPVNTENNNTENVSTENTGSDNTSTEQTTTPTSSETPAEQPKEV